MKWNKLSNQLREDMAGEPSPGDNFQTIFIQKYQKSAP